MEQAAGVRVTSSTLVIDSPLTADFIRAVFRAAETAAYHHVTAVRATVFNPGFLLLLMDE